MEFFEIDCILNDKIIKNNKYYQLKLKRNNIFKIIWARIKNKSNISKFIKKYERKSYLDFDLNYDSLEFENNLINQLEIQKNNKLFGSISNGDRINKILKSYHLKNKMVLLVNWKLRVREPERYPKNSLIYREELNENNIIHLNNFYEKNLKIIE